MSEIEKDARKPEVMQLEDIEKAPTNVEATTSQQTYIRRNVRKISAPDDSADLQ